MRTHHLVAAFILLCSSVVFAGEPLKDNKDVVGAWVLEAVARAVGKVKTEENRGWEFKPDGTLVTSGYNRVTKVDDRMSFSYRVEDGKLVLIDPARPTKPQILEVHERTDKTMTLIGGWEGVYYFRRQ